MSHKRTLCNRCKHGNEHHPDRGPCTYGHDTVTGGCLCPGFNARKSVPDREKESPEEIVRVARDRLQAELDRFCAEVKRAWSMKSALDPDAMLDAMGKAMAIPRLEATPSIAVPLLDPPKTSEPVIAIPQTSDRDTVSNVGPPSPKRAIASPQVGRVDLAPESGEASSNDELSKGERACLNAIVRYGDGCTEAGLVLHTGYKATSRATYVKALRALDLVATRDGRHFATDEGVELAGDLPDLEPGANLLARLSELGPGERTIFHMIGAYGEEGCSSALLRASVSSLKETSRLTYLKALRGKLMVSTEDDVHRLTDPFRQSLAVLPKDMKTAKPTPSALVALWSAALPQGESTIFAVVADLGHVSLRSLMVRTNYKETSVRTYVKALRKRKLVVPDGEGFALAAELCG